MLETATEDANKLPLVIERWTAAHPAAGIHAFRAIG